MIQYSKFDTCPWKPKLEEAYLQEFLEKNFKPKNYNQFKWWRQWSPKKKPLSKYCSTERKIKNGDYDELSYKYEAQLLEHKLRRCFLRNYDDQVKYLEKSSIDIARRKKLLEDYEKSEKERLETLYTDLSIEFNISALQVQRDIISSKKKSLYKVYKELSKKYS